MYNAVHITHYLSSPLKGKTTMWETLPLSNKGKNYLCRKPYICYSIFNPSWIREPSVTYSHKTHKGKFWESLNHLLYHITLVKPDSFFSDQHAILWSQCLLHFHVI